jgi:hypothetical protein
MVDGVAEGIHDVQVEGTFPVSSNRQFVDCQLIVRMGEQAPNQVGDTADIRTFLVSVHDPICSDSGDRTSTYTPHLLKRSRECTIRFIPTNANGGDVPNPRATERIPRRGCYL